ncbi:uncharacterized protein N7496_006061 [Penicillium cataractarum]|uniref:Uncharacterized protein n=1 Tax=Penicillium cataractarum TaxID=2100454 RepID=A0A9W9V711_9EURO|nr:uncharacterized protein N7496_006061 [Penicillium cataractarum]KAJ5369969.1 hypothetical protein N7496_006061 [Penicillium cataractarum]
MANWEKQKELEDAQRNELDFIADEKRGQSKKKQPFAEQERAASSIRVHETLAPANDEKNSISFDESEKNSDSARDDVGSLYFQPDFSMDDA